MTDNRETQVMSLADMAKAMVTVGPTDETMPLRVVEQAKAQGTVSPDSSVTGRLPRKMNGQFAGPFPVHRVGGLSLRRFAEEAPIEDVVEVVKALSASEVAESNEPEGVEQKSSDDTATHALPAVEKMTGKPSEAIDRHRTAARVQRAMGPYGYAVWFGEHTRSFWVMDSRGLHEFEDITAMYQGMGWQKL